MGLRLRGDRDSNYPCSDGDASSGRRRPTPTGVAANARRRGAARRETSMRFDGDGRPGARARERPGANFNSGARGERRVESVDSCLLPTGALGRSPARVLPSARGATLRTPRAGERHLPNPPPVRRARGRDGSATPAEPRDDPVGRSGCRRRPVGGAFCSLPSRPPDAIFSFSVSAQARGRQTPVRHGMGMGRGSLGENSKGKGLRPLHRAAGGGPTRPPTRRRREGAPRARARGRPGDKHTRVTCTTWGERAAAARSELRARAAPFRSTRRPPRRGGGRARAPSLQPPPARRAARRTREAHARPPPTRPQRTPTPRP